MKKKSPLKLRILSVLIVVLMLTMNVSNVFADTITFVQEGVGSLIYHYTGKNQAPSSNAASPLNMAKYPTDNSAVPIYKYQLANKDNDNEKFWTYCSDQGVIPKSWLDNGKDPALLYQRTPLEKVTQEYGLFHGDIPTSAAKLRAILLNSDLYLPIEDMQAASGIPTLTESEAIAGTQLAIWHLVNNKTPEDTLAFGKTAATQNVRDFYAYLGALDGVGPDQMARIEVDKINRLVEPGSGTYQVVLDYAVKGEGASESNVLNNFVVSATYGPGKTPITSITQGDGTVKISGIPTGNDLYVTLSGSQKDVRSVYIYTPEKKSSSQTLVSVIKGEVPLKTVVEVTQPKNLQSVEIFKSWQNNDGTSMPGTVVKDYESTFSFTYASGDFEGYRVIDDVTIKGNGKYKTADVFNQMPVDEGGLYKVEEVSPDLPDGTVMGAAKYFKVENNGVVWTDSAGNAFTSQTGGSTFINSVDVEIGSVEVVKTVKNDGKPGEKFTFTAQWKAAGADDSAYTTFNNENYTLVENGISEPMATSNVGTFELSAGQRAIFDSIPIGSTLKVTESVTNISSRYDVSAESQVAVAQAGPTTLEFVNTYIVGSMVIEKKFAADSVIDWGNFPSGIRVTVNGPDSYSNTVTLTEAAPTVELANLPAGNYTVEEQGVALTGYHLSLNGTLISASVPASISAAVDKGIETTVTFTNSYTENPGSIEIEKKLDGPTTGQAAGKSFEFEITDSNGNPARDIGGDLIGKVTLPTPSGAWSIIIPNIASGEYTVAELDVPDIDYFTFGGATYSTEGGKAQVSLGLTPKVTVTNKYERIMTGKVYVAKTGSKDWGDEFVFQAKVDGTVQNNKAFTIINADDTTEPGMTNSTTGYFNLKIGQTAVFENLPLGASFTATETADSNYITTIGAESTNTASVVIDAEGKTININNERILIDLTLDKIVTGVPWSSFPDGIKFTVTGSVDNWGEGIAGLTQDSGNKKVYTVFLKGNDDNQASITFEKIPAGDYKIVETSGLQDGQTGDPIKGTAELFRHNMKTSFSISGGPGGSGMAFDTGNKTYLADATVTFSNDYTLKTGEISFTKSFDYRPLADEVFEFTIVFDESMPEEAAVYGSKLLEPAVWSADRKTVTFKLNGIDISSSVSITGIPEGVSYTMTEKAPGSYSISDPVTGTIEIGNNVVTWKNTHTASGSLNVKKEVKFDGSDADYGDDFQFNFTLGGSAWNGSFNIASEDGNSDGTCTDGIFTLKTGQTAQFRNLPLGVAYEILETKDGYRTIVNGNSTSLTTGTITTESNTIIFVNERIKVDLEVKKTVSGEAKSQYDDSDFTFIVSKDGTEEGALKSVAFTVKGETGYTDSTTGEFTIKGGETASFTGLPAGNYTVTEVNIPNDAGKYVITTTADGTTAQRTSLTKAIFEGSEAFAFNNNYDYQKGSLTVSKSRVVIGKNLWDAFDAPSSFVFTLYRLNGEEWQPVTDVSYTTTNPASALRAINIDGTFTLSGGQVAVFSNNLINGTYYVAETRETATGYTLEVTGDGNAEANLITVTNGATQSKIVTNTYTRESDASISVTKEVKGINQASSVKAEDLVYTFTLYAGSVSNNNAVTNWNSNNATGSARTNANGQFTLKHGETAAFSGLPDGINYYVVESDRTVDGYARTGGSEMTLNGESGTLAFVNEYSRVTGDLTITKTMANDSAYKPETWEYQFNITGPVDWTNVNSSVATGGAIQLTPAEDGYTFWLTSDNPKLELKGLPGGEYAINEIAASKEYDDDGTGYVLVTTNEGLTNGKVTVGGGEQKVNFTNRYRIEGAVLTLNKSFEGIAGNDAHFEYAFELQNPNGGIETIVITGADKVTKILPIINSRNDGNDQLRTYKIREVSAPDITKYTYLGNSFTIKQGAYGPESDIDKDEDGWITFTVSDDVEVIVDCTNNYLQDGAILRVTKDVDGLAGDDVFKFQVSSGDGSLKFPKSFFIEDEELGLVPAGSTGNDGTFYLKAGQTAVFTKLDTATTYTVTELETIGNAGIYELTGVRGEKFTYTIEVNEKSAPEFVLSDKSDVDGRSGNSFSASIGEKIYSEGDRFPGLEFTFTNTRLTGGLAIEKTLTGEAYDDKPFMFYITFDEEYDSDEEGVKTRTVDPARFEKDLNVSGAEYWRINSDKKQLEIKIDAGATVEIDGIPAGLQYYIVEDPGAYYFSAKSVGAYGVIEADNSLKCDFENTRKTGQIMLSKRIITSAEATADDSELFDVAVLFTSDGGNFSDSIFDDGYFEVIGMYQDLSFSGEGSSRITMNLKVKNGDFLIIDKIPVGIKYEIKEDLDSAQNDLYVSRITGVSGFVAPYIGDTGTKQHPEISNVNIINYCIPKGSLDVSKEVSATLGSPLWNQKFSFTLKLTQPGEDVGDNAYDQLIVDEKLDEINPIYYGTEEKIDALRATIEQQQAEYDEEYGEDYKDALDALRAMVNEDGTITFEAYDVLAEEGAFEEVEPVECEVCGGTHEVQVFDVCDYVDEDGNACVNGTIKTTDLEFNEDTEEWEEVDVFEECPACGGEGKVAAVDEDGGYIFEECANCNEEGIDEAATAAAQKDADDLVIEAAISDAMKAFDENPAVIARESITNDEYDLAELEDLFMKVKKVKEYLDMGIAVFYDKDYRFNEDALMTDPVEFDKDSQIEAYYIDDEGNKVQLSLSAVGFTVNETTHLITFSLGHGEHILITGLPEHSRYIIEEIGMIDRYEALKGVTITAESGTSTDKDRRTVSGIIAVDGEGIFNIIQYLNEFEDAKGSLSVDKTWADPNGNIEAVTVSLVVDQVITDRKVTLSAENGWHAKFDNLELFHVYGVFEDVPDGFVANYSSSGIELLYANKDSALIKITNSKKPSRHDREHPDRVKPDPRIDNPNTPLSGAEPGDESYPDATATIGDSEVPLVNREDPPIVIPPTDVPLGDIPQTGLGSMAFSFSMLGVSLSALLTLMFRRKKRETV